MNAPRSASLTVEEVFPLNFLAGPIVWGTYSGSFRPGDRVVLDRPDGTRAEGHIILVEYHRPPNARPDQIGTAIGGDIAAVVRPGDVLTISPPGAGSDSPAERNPP